MKTISGKVVSTSPISLSDAAKSLTKFASSDQGASHALSFFVQQAAHSFNNLVHFHNKLTPNNVPKLEQISQISHKAGVKVETLVKNENLSNGFQENKKSKNLGKVKDQKVINNEERVDIGEQEMGNSEKSEPDFGKNDGYVKMETGGEEVKDDGMISSDKKKKKKKKNKGVGDNEVEDQKVIKNVEHVVIGEGQAEKSEKNEPEFVKTETGGEEVKDDDGMISRDKKKKKKKNRGVGEHESEVEKVKEDLVVMEDGERKKSKSVDRDASGNDGSAEQRHKKKSKKWRIEGEK